MYGRSGGLFALYAGYLYVAVRFARDRSRNYEVQIRTGVGGSGGGASIVDPFLHFDSGVH